MLLRKGWTETPFLVTSLSFWHLFCWVLLSSLILRKHVMSSFIFLVFVIIVSSVLSS